METGKREYLFFDIEVFRYDSLLLLKDRNNKTVGQFWSEQPGAFPEDSPNGFEGVADLVRGNILIGFNNYGYDDLILQKMMTGRPQREIKDLSDRIIRKENTENERRAIQKFLRQHDIITLDTRQQLPGELSLKQIEGNMGRSIIESEIPFDLDRPLTEAERETVLKYCAYDVESTIAVFNQREKDYFDPKDELLKMYSREDCYRWNTTTFSAELLRPAFYEMWQKPRIPEQFWRKNPQIPENVWEYWENQERLAEDLAANTKKGSITVKRYGCDITFSLGGLHGTAEYGSEFRHVKDLDVQSMYPSIIINLGFLKEKTELFRQIRDNRIAMKKTDPVRSGAMKLVLNSVYGLLRSEYSKLYNPMACVTVCIFGQIALFDLCGRLYAAGYRLLNINTDGVCFTDPSGAGEKYQEIRKQWEQDYNLSLDLDEFDRLIQKDVNNYVAITGTSVKTKGGNCNLYREGRIIGKSDARIVHIAFVDNLLYGKDPLVTIMEHLDEPELYQYVLKPDKGAVGAVDREGNRLPQKVNRVFAVREDCPGETKLYKLRKDGRQTNFTSVPDHMLVYNGELSQFREFRTVVDVAHYYEEVRKKLNSWKVS